MLNYHFYKIDLLVTIIFLIWFFLKLYAISYMPFQLAYCHVYSTPFVNNKFTNKSMIKVIILSMRRSFIESIKSSSSFYQKIENSFVGKRSPTNDELWEKRLMDKVSKEVSENLTKSDLELQRIKDQLSMHESILRNSKSSFLDDGSKVAAIIGVGTTSFFGYHSWTDSLELDLIKVEQKIEAEKWFLEKEVLTNQLKEDKIKIADLTKENSTLTRENLNEHDGTNTTFVKDNSKSTIGSKGSVQSSLDLDIDKIILESNGIPMSGNISGYRFKKYESK